MNVTHVATLLTVIRGAHPLQAVIEEQELPPEKRIVANVGKMDAKKHLGMNVGALMTTNINQVRGDCCL